MKIDEIIHNLKNNDIVIPEFQREYVWKRDRAKELIASLLREYPVGGLLLWKTTDPPALKNIQDLPDKFGSVQVLLDGQQRCTALYMLCTGAVPPYYKDSDIIGNDPRELAYNLYTGELSYWQNSLMNGNSYWQYIVDCMTGNGVNPVQIATEKYTLIEGLKEALEVTPDLGQKRLTKRAFGSIRDQVESTGAIMTFRPHNTWQIILPTGVTIKTTIEDLCALCNGPKQERDWREWDSKDWQLHPDRFLSWWESTFKQKVKESIEEFGDLTKLTERLYNNYAKLQSIRQRELPEQMVPTHASFSDAIEIFDKINRQGERVSPGDLALAHVTGKWPEAKNCMKVLSERLINAGFNFDLNFLTRGLITVITGRGNIDVIQKIDRDSLQNGWNKLEEIFDYLAGYLPDSALIHSTKDLKSNNVLLPLIAFLSKNGNTFRTEEQGRHSVHWLHNALMWGRYESQANTKLEEDLAIIRNNPSSPWSLLCDKIISQKRGGLEITSSDLSGELQSSRFYRLVYMVFKGQHARDWFNGLPLNSTTASYQIHSHHIFPKAYLAEHGWEEADLTQKKLINEIANRAFLTEKTNLAISASSPAEYLPQIREQYPSALAAQCIPDDPSLWEAAQFQDFLDCRRKLIAEAINTHFKKLLEGNKYNREKEEQEVLIKLLNSDECETLEFKETWHIDSFQSNRDGTLTSSKKMQMNCLKSVAAFLNSSGGTLLIGVTDEKSVEGLDRDAEILDGSYDRLLQQISTVTTKALGVGAAPFYTVKILEHEEHRICRIDVKENDSGGTWVNFSGENKFFIRRGNTTESLNGEDAYNYVQNKWD